MENRSLHDTLMAVKADLYFTQQTVKALIDAALPYTKDSNKEHTELKEAVRNAYILLSLDREVN